jgi:transposase
MRKLTLKYVRVGVDLAKNYLQIHALPADGGAPVARKLGRAKFLEFFASIEPREVGMEACGSAHYWARELSRLGHKVVLMPPIYVKPYVKRGKTTRSTPPPAARRCRDRRCASWRSRARSSRRR